MGTKVLNDDYGPHAKGKCITGIQGSLISFFLFWYKKREVGERQFGVFLKPRETRSVEAFQVPLTTINMQG